MKVIALTINPEEMAKNLFMKIRLNLVLASTHYDSIAKLIVYKIKN